MLIVFTIVLTILVFVMPFALNHITNFTQGNRQIRLLLAFTIGVIIVLTLGLRNFDEDLSFNFKLFQCYRGLANQLSYKWRTYGLKYDEKQFKIISTGICNIVANIALFVPFGCLLPRALPNQNFTWWKTLLIGFGFSLIVETTQLVTHRGCFDLDDLFHNSFGTVLGYALGKCVLFYTRNSETDS